VLHGTTGSGTQFLRAEFAGELFRSRQTAGPTTFFVVIVDNIGHGQSSKPATDLRAAFPKYGYRDMVTAQYRLLTKPRRQSPPPRHRTSIKGTGGKKNKKNTKEKKKKK